MQFFTDVLMFFFFFWSGCRFQEFVVGYGWVRVLLLSMMCWFVSSYSFCVMLYRCWFYHGYLGSSLFIHLYLWVVISYNYEIFLWEELRLLLKKIFFFKCYWDRYWRRFISISDCGCLELFEHFLLFSNTFRYKSSSKVLIIFLPWLLYG